MVVLCIMHIYAHILAAEDDEAEGCANCGGPYLCKCIPAFALHLAPLSSNPMVSPSKLTSLAVSSRSREGERSGKTGNRGGKRGEERWRGKKKDTRDTVFIDIPPLQKSEKRGKQWRLSLLFFFSGGGRERTISISRRDFSYIARHRTFHIQFVPLVSR